LIWSESRDDCRQPLRLPALRGFWGVKLRAGAGPEHLGRFQQRTIEVALVGAVPMAEHPLGGLVEIVRLWSDIGHVGKHGAELRQVSTGIGPLRPAGEAMDGGFEEPVGEIVLSEFVVSDIKPVASPAVGATGLGGDEPAAFEQVEPLR
jgi:hypothetical protein